jgi:hypothetical protein
MLDISMQYYTVELDNASKELCRICMPFGNYQYNRLPMGISQAPDISQEIMEDLFRNFNEVDVYIDDIRVFSNDWDTHCVLLTCILKMTLKLITSQSILTNVMGQFKILIGLVIG